MNGIKLTVFLVVCCAIGAGATLLYQRFHPREHPTISPIRTGIGSPPPQHGFLLPSSGDAEALSGFPALHATAVAVEYSPDVARLSGFVAKAHALGLKVVLLPPVTSAVKHAAAGDAFTGGDPYPQPLPAIGALAQQANVDVLCISWLNEDPDPAYWKPQTAALRKVFHGSLLFAATPDVLPVIEFWDAVDLIGAIGPFDLPLRSATPTRPLDLHDLRTAWASWLDSLESLSMRYGKRLVLLDEQTGVKADAARESLKYEALLVETKGRDAMEGLFLAWTPTADVRTQAADPLAVNHYPDLLKKMITLWVPSPVETSPAPGAEPDDFDAAP